MYPCRCSCRSGWCCSMGKASDFTFPAEFVPTGIINTTGATNNNKMYRLMTDGTKADIVFQENITAEQEIWFNVPYISQ